MSRLNLLLCPGADAEALRGIHITNIIEAAYSTIIILRFNFDERLVPSFRWENEEEKVFVRISASKDKLFINIGDIMERAVIRGNTYSLGKG